MVNSVDGNETLSEVPKAIIELKVVKLGDGKDTNART